MKLKKKKVRFANYMRTIGKATLLLLLLLPGFAINAQTVSITSSDDEAAENPGDGASFTITRNPTNNLFSNTVTYTITGTAVSGVDYTTPPTSVTLNIVNNGSVTTQINDIADDSFIEGLETIVITLQTVNNGGTISTTQNSVTININDNDTGIFTLEVTDGDAAEEGQDQGRYLLRLDKQNASGDLTVPYILTGTATNGGANSDYAVTTQNQGAFIFPSGSGILQRQLVVVPIDDVLAEANETVILTLGTPTNSNPANSALFSITSIPEAQRTVVIADNDCAAGDAVPTINATPNTVCNPPAANVNLNTYVVGGAGSAPANASLRWSTQPNPAVVGDLLAGPTVTVSDTYYAVYWANDNSCFSPTSDVTVTFNTPPTAGIETAPTIDRACNNENDEFGLTRLDLVDLITGQDAGNWAFTTGPAVVNPTGGNNRVDFRNQPAGAYIFTYTTTTAIAPCTNDSLSVTINVSDCDPCEAGDDAPVLDNNVPRTFCDAITTSLNDYAPNAGPNGTVLRWATDENDPTGSFVPNPRVADPLPGTYYGFYFDATNNCASPTLTLTLEQFTTPEITSTTPNERCAPGTVVLTATANLDATIRWYTSSTGGTPVTGGSFTTPSISGTTTYFVEASANGCTSSPRIEVIAIVNPQPSSGTPSNASSCSDPNNGPTTVDLDDRLTGEDIGTWEIVTDPSNTLAINPSNIVNFQDSPDGNYVFRFTTTGAQGLCENVSSEVTISVNDCDIDTDGDGLFDGPEATLGTNPNEPDTDGDGINDGVEVGDDIANPLDGDADGIIDAIESNILDSDSDGVVDQLDPGNDNPCVPDNSNGLCDTDEDGISDGDEEANGTNPLDACDPDINNENCDPTPIDLEVQKIVDKPDAVAGDEVIFTVTVNNLSGSKARSVTIGDLLETGFDYKTHTASVGSYDQERGIWIIFEIPANGSATLTVTVDVLEGGPYTNLAELLESFPLDETPANNSAEVTLNVDLPEGIDLKLEKFARIVGDSLDIEENERKKEIRPLVGDEIIFIIEVTNESNEDAVSNIQVLDAIEALDQGGFTYMSSIADKGEFNPQTGLWVIPELLKNEVAILEIQVSVPTPGTFSNTAEIIQSTPLDSEGNYENNSDTVTVVVSERTESEIGIIFNQFSPNNDGTNDALKINKKRIGENGLVEEVDMAYSIKIFNRYGSLVFEGDQLTNEVIWDGSRDGKEVPDGTYFYVLNVTLQEEVEGVDATTTKKGWIQLIR